MLQFLLLAAVAVAAPEVEVRPLAGKAATGALVELSSAAVVISAADGQRSFAASDLRAVRILSDSQTLSVAGDLRIELVDGSTLKAASYTAEDGVGVVSFGPDRVLKIPTRAIRYVRLGDVRQASLDDQWVDLLSNPVAGDLLVVRRQAVEEITVDGNVSERTTYSLDPFQGVLKSVAKDNAVFEMDGDQFTPSLEKLEGFIYHHPAGREMPQALCSINSCDGARWRAASLRLDESEVAFATPAGVEHRLPLDRISSLDFAGANIVYLSDVDPESTDWTPFISQAAASAALQQWYRFSRDRSLDGGLLLLDGVSYDKGLGLHSRTELVYRVPRDFKRFRATAGINDRASHLGEVHLVIRGDQETLFEQTIQARGEKGRAAPVNIDLDVSNTRRLRILVDFGGGLLDVADHLDMCDARFTK